MKELQPEQAADLAKERGFDVTCEELEEAIKEIRKDRKQGAVELDFDEMDKVTGGSFGNG